MKIKLPSIEDELLRQKIPYEHKNAENLSVLCPFHDDDAPSLHIHKESQIFTCRVCKVGGPFIKYLAKQLGVTQNKLEDDLRRHYNIWDDKAVFDTATIEAWHQALFTPAARRLLEELYKRKVPEAFLRKYRLGFDNNRITIPVRMQNGATVQVRSYKPGAPGAEKMYNLKPPNRKPHKRRVFTYPVDQLGYETVVVTGGECKALAAAAQLNEHKIGAVCATSGEGNWDIIINRDLKGKKVIVVLDVDEAGKNAANRICRFLAQDCDVWIAFLPLDKEKHPKGDINDFIAEGGQMLDVVKSAKKWSPILESKVSKKEAVDQPFHDVLRPKNFNRRVRFEGYVESTDAKQWTIPLEARVLCARDQENACPQCPRYTVDENHRFRVDAESRNIVAMCDATDYNANLALQAEIGIPRACKAHELEIASTQTVTYCWLGDIDSSLNVDDSLRPASGYFVGENSIKEHASFEFEGTPTNHPKDQSSVVVLSQAERIGDSLQSFELTPEVHKQLCIFRPEEWTLAGLQKKLADVHLDLSKNVTGIVGRDELQLGIELSTFSPLRLSYLQGTREKTIKGWVEVLIVGDTAQGKSEITSNFRDFLEQGVMISCERVSGVGLTVSHDKSPHGSHMAKWGVFPKNDKKQVILDELSRLNDDALSRMMNMRSSGILNFAMAGVEKSKHARVRLIALSNPKFGKSVADIGSVLDIVPDLMSEHAAIRRWDLVLCPVKGEVSSVAIGAAATGGERVEHKYTQELHQKLLFWAWNPRHIAAISEELSEQATGYVRTLSKWNSAKCPIVSDDQALKLYRLAAALACRTFSCDEKGNVVVRPCHLEYVYKFMLREYGKKIYGFDEIEEEALRTNDFDAKQLVTDLRSSSFNRSFARRFLLAKKRFTKHEFATQVTDEALITLGNVGPLLDVVLGHLCRNNAVQQLGQAGFFVNTEFKRWLRENESTWLGDDEPPPHIKDEF